MIKSDTKRLEELKLKVYGLVAKNLLMDEKSPHSLEPNSIESHGGRRNKAIRLLREAEVYSYGKIVTFEDDSEGYGNIPNFKFKWEELHDLVYNGGPANNIGYRFISHLTSQEAIYVYWHRDLYIITDGEIYPRALEDDRQKAILRSIIEHDVTKQYTRRLERYLSLAEGSLTDRILYGVTVRNFAASPLFMQEGQLTGENSLEQEYLHNMKYFQAVHHYFQRMLQLIKDAGGPDEIIKRMRQEAIEEIKFNAPRWIAAQPPEDWCRVPIGTDKAKSGKEIILKKSLARYLLDYGNFLDYDILYPDDLFGCTIKSAYIREGDVDSGMAWMEETQYIPSRSNLYLIKGYEHPSTGDDSTMSGYSLYSRRKESLVA